MGWAVLAAPISQGWPSSLEQGLPCATQQLTHLLPCGSWMSPCLDLQGM